MAVVFIRPPVPGNALSVFCVGLFFLAEGFINLALQKPSGSFSLLHIYTDIHLRLC